MKLSNKIALVTLIGLLTGCGTQKKSSADPSVLVNSERAFAAAAAAQGTRDAFLAYCADSAVMFVPDLVRVKEQYGSSEKRPGLLSWEPIYAEIASAGDLGWTTGPWEWREKSAADTPQVSGHYITLWKMQPDSTWKFVLDIGIAHESHKAPAPALILRTLDYSENKDDVFIRRAREALIQLEYTFSSASAYEGLTAAYTEREAEDIRLYRMGEFPVQGADAVSASLSRNDGVLTWEVSHADVSRSADLGYTYGISSLAGPNTTTRFSFVHIWRRAADDQWKVVLDIQIPIGL